MEDSEKHIGCPAWIALEADEDGMHWEGYCPTHREWLTEPQCLVIDEVMA